jgi:hypothetical protein
MNLKLKKKENAYVYALQEYYEKLQQHMFDTGTKPDFSLASGTYILCKEEEFRTEEEQEFLDSMLEEYFANLPLEVVSLELQIECVEQTKQIFKKPPKERTKLEKSYLKNLTTFKNEIVALQKKHGLKVENSLLSSTCVFAKYKEQLTEEDSQFLQEMETVSSIENDQ